MATNKQKIRKPPAFQLYSSDFLIEVQFFTDAQIAAYIQLLCYQHQTGRISETGMLHYNKSKDPVILSLFTKDKNGFYYNEALEKYMLNTKEISEKNRKNIEKYWEGKREKERQDGEENKEEKNNINHHITEYDDE